MKITTRGKYPAIFEGWRETGFIKIYDLSKIGLNEDQIFDLHEIAPRLRPRLKAHKDFRRVFDKGRAERSMELLIKINNSIANNNSVIIKEAARNIIGWKDTMDIPHNVHVTIDAPKWMKAKKTTGVKGKRADNS